MAYFFGDGFDLYTALTDCGTYWDASFGSVVTLGLSASGRFAGSRGLAQGGSFATPYITKTSSVNDAVHHFSVAFQQTSALSGTNVVFYITLYDAATAQCSVCFRSDGAIILTSGNAGGTTLATYTGATAAINTWYQFEVEVVVSNTAGSISVRKNGNTSNDFSLGSLNTRGSANNYANKIGIGCFSASTMVADDFLWRSDAASVAWVGDIRCFTRMPAADSAVAWTRSTGSTNASCVDEAQQNAATDYVYSSTVGQSDLYTIAPIGSTPAGVLAVTTRGYVQKSDAGTRLAAVQLQSGGAFTSWSATDHGTGLALSNSNLTVTTSTTAIANIRGISSQPPSVKFYFEGTLNSISGTMGLGIANASADMTTSGYANTAFLATNGNVFINGNVLGSIGTSVTSGTVVCVAVDLVNKLLWVRAGASGNWNGNAGYAPGGSGGLDLSSVPITTNTYAYAAFNGSSTGASVIANFGPAGFAGAVPSGFTAGVPFGGVTVQATPLALPAGSWAWNWRTDLTDPATAAAWTAVGVNAALIGAIVTT